MKKEQRPQDWYDAFCRISKGFAAMDKETPVEAVIMSGQMQDVIPVDREAVRWKCCPCIQTAGLLPRPGN